MPKLILAGCVILDSAGKVLLLHRNTPKRTQWETPGGKIDEGEDPKKAAVREIKEELGVDVELEKKLGQKDFQEDDFVMEYIWFLAKVINGIPRVMEKDTHNQIEYFSWEDLKDKDDLSGNAKNLVAAYFAKEITL